MIELELYKNYFYKELEEWFSNITDTDPNITWNE